MKKLLKWFLLLNKRLYKKLTFLLILVLIPLLVFGYGILAQEESGILTIALAGEEEDPFTTQVMQDLKESTNLIRFVICQTPVDAQKMVSDSKANAAWIFEEDLENCIYRFVQKPARRNAFVQVLEREDSVLLRLAREKLSGAMFRHCSRALYLMYIRENAPELSEIPDDELMRHYDNFTVDGDLFEFAFLDATPEIQDPQDANYLLTVVRGLLAVVITLGGLAAAMYYIHDDKVGTFSLVPQKNKAAVEFGCQVITVLNIGVVAFLALFFADLSVSVGREVLLLIVYTIAVSLFAMTLRRLCGKLAVVGTALPVLVVVMLVICPVFFDFGALRPLQYLFPPTYYINAVYSNRFMLLMGVYSAVLLAIYVLSGKLLKRR